MAVIHDKFGEEYQIVEDHSQEFLYFNIEHHGRRIGQAICRFKGKDVLHVNDLHLRDNVMRPPLFFVPMIFGGGSFPPERFRKFNYQQRGLGTAMLEFLANFARSKSVKRIEGEVKHHDLKRNPDLVNWYRRRGFKEITDGENKGCVARISLIV
jgi:GNAT superfamily N-acetyltransferase